MPLPLLLDSNVLSKVVRPTVEEHKPIAATIYRLLPLTTETMRMAADLWAQTRIEGQLRGSEENLDVDVILAAQARQANGQIVTVNERHFRNIAAVFDWKIFHAL